MKGRVLKLSVDGKMASLAGNCRCFKKEPKGNVWKCFYTIAQWASDLRVEIA